MMAGTDETQTNNGKVSQCAFLRMVKPDTTNMGTFLRDCSANGLQWLSGLFVASNVVYKQQGLKALLTGCAPNIYELDKVPGVSHDDLYLTHLDEVQEMLHARVDENGNISLQDCIDAKVLCKDKVNVEATKKGKPLINIIKDSQVETEVLYMRAGGAVEATAEYPNGCVNCKDFLLLMQGKSPVKKTDGYVSLSLCLQVEKLGTWPEGDEKEKGQS